MSSNTTIVQFTKENYPLFDELAFQRFYGRYQSEQAPAHPQDGNRIAEALADPNLMVYAAVREGQWVGWISLIYMPKVSRTNGQGYLFVDELWTHPNHRRQGIAKQLVAHAETVCAQRKAVGIRLVVNADNREAINLYQSSGYAERDVAVCMDKELQPVH